MRTNFVCGNWKMNTTRASAIALAEACVAASQKTPSVRVGIAPPAVWLSDVAATIAGSTVALFAQNGHPAASGAFTGENSYAMLKEAGAIGLLVGHSERRQLFGETDAIVASKVAGARALGLEVILCVGETLDERDAGTTLEVVNRQVDAGLAEIATLDGITIAYEPVWAIGTGRNATAAQAQEVHAAIRSRLAIRFGAEAAAVVIQYGGSVKPETAAALLAESDVDGALVGGASLDGNAFGSIIAAGAL
jgi:triosephosphate isomerase